MPAPVSAWLDRHRWEVDDPGREWLWDHHGAVYDALRQGNHARDIGAEAADEFDIHLAWLLRTQGLAV